MIQVGHEGTRDYLDGLRRGTGQDWSAPGGAMRAP